MNIPLINHTSATFNVNHHARMHAPESSLASIIQRIFTYVVPGAILGAGLSIATTGFGGMIVTFMSVGGIPQKIRECMEGKISLKNEWNKLYTFEKVFYVGFMALLGLAVALSVAVHFRIPHTTSRLGPYICFGIAGAIGGTLFSAGLSNPPLIDLSKYEIKKY